jgi:hypothetical protein
MVRPEAFQQPYIALQNVPYLCGDDPSKAGSGGVLSRGKTVWARQSDASQSAAGSITAYVEGVGLISVNPRALVRSDIRLKGTIDGNEES